MLEAEIDDVSLRLKTPKENWSRENNLKEKHKHRLGCAKGLLKNVPRIGHG